MIHVYLCFNFLLPFKANLVYRSLTSAEVCITVGMFFIAGPPVFPAVPLQYSCVTTRLLHMMSNVFHYTFTIEGSLPLNFDK